MKSALQSLALVSLTVLICLGLAWLYMKSKSANQLVQKPLPTTLFDSSEKLLVFAPVDKIPTTDSKTLDAKIGLWIDTQITQDGKAIVLSERELPNPNYDPASADRSPDTKVKSLSPKFLAWSDVKKAKPEAQLLEDVIKEHPSRRLIINVINYSPGADVVLSELISNLKADERIIFHSEQDGPLNDLRKVRPMWLYGTSRAQIVQTLWLTTIGLQGISPIKGDVLITPYRANESNQRTIIVTPELIREAHRRSMKVLVGPVSKSEADELIQLGVDGIITNEPKEFTFPQL